MCVHVWWFPTIWLKGSWIIWINIFVYLQWAFPLQQCFWSLNYFWENAFDYKPLLLRLKLFGFTRNHIATSVNGHGCPAFTRTTQFINRQIIVPVYILVQCWMRTWPVSEVHKSSWYMIHYGGKTPKRHYAFSNSKHVAQLNAGQLLGWVHKKRALQEQGESYELVDKYTDSSGKARWKGNKRLRGSE